MNITRSNKMYNKDLTLHYITIFILTRTFVTVIFNISCVFQLNYQLKGLPPQGVKSI